MFELIFALELPTTIRALASRSRPFTPFADSASLHWCTAAEAGRDETATRHRDRTDPTSICSGT